MGSVVNETNELGAKVKYFSDNNTCLVQPVDAFINKLLKSMVGMMWVDWFIDVGLLSNHTLLPTCKDTPAWVVMAYCE